MVRRRKRAIRYLQEEDVLTTSRIARSTGIVSAPLWDSKTSTFAGLLTTSDYINVIQYYFQNPAALGEIDQFRLDSLRGMSLACPHNLSYPWTGIDNES